MYKEKIMIIVSLTTKNPDKVKVNFFFEPIRELMLKTIHNLKSKEIQVLLLDHR